MLVCFYYKSKISAESQIQETIANSKKLINGNGHLALSALDAETILAP